MKVMLKENIEDLGKKGDVVRVAPGYGRNYLIPKKIALEVTPSNTRMIEMVQKSLRKGLEKEMATYKSLAEKLNTVTLAFERKAGEKDHIFGSVSVSDIREALAAQGLDIEKKKILLDEPIKHLGNYTVAIKVFHEERAEIKLEVKKEGAALEPEEDKGSEEKLNEGKEDAGPTAEAIAVEEEPEETAEAKEEPGVTEEVTADDVKKSADAQEADEAKEAAGEDVAGGGKKEAEAEVSEESGENKDE